MRSVQVNRAATQDGCVQDVLSPLVSVIIPTYRGAKTIRAAIDSVLAQTHENFEIIVNDDGSDDGTHAIVIGCNDSRVRLFINPKNLGPEGNWNLGLSRAQGRYIKVLPHDDLLKRTCLEQQVRVLEADISQSISLVFCARTVINEQGRTLTTRRFSKYAAGVVEPKALIKACVQRGTNLVGEPGAVLFRASDARRVGGFEGQYRYVIDLQYWAKLLQLGQAYYIDECLCSFRVSATSWSYEIGRGQPSDFVKLVGSPLFTQMNAFSNWDRAQGRCMARFNALARKVFYVLYLTKRN